MTKEDFGSFFTAAINIICPEKEKQECRDIKRQVPFRPWAGIKMSHSTVCVKRGDRERDRDCHGGPSRVED